MTIFKAVQLDQQDSVPIGAWQTDIKGAPSQVTLYVSRTNQPNVLLLDEKIKDKNYFFTEKWARFVFGRITSCLEQKLGRAELEWGIVNPCVIIRGTWTVPGKPLSRELPACKN